MARTMLRGVEMQMAVGQFDAAVGLTRDVRVVRHHQDGVSGVVQFAENLEDDRLPPALVAALLTGASVVFADDPPSTQPILSAPTAGSDLPDMGSPAAAVLS